MQIKKLNESQRSVVQSNNGMMNYLTNLDREQEHTKPSWLCDMHSPEWILRSWLHQLRSLASGSDTDAKVYQFDISQLEKWGPQGGHPPMRQCFFDVFGKSYSSQALTKAPWHQAKSSSAFVSWERAKRAARLELTQYAHSLRPVSYGNVSVDMAARDTLNSNSGYPDFGRRKLPRILRKAITDAENGNWREYPAIALFRYYNQKLRGVWMYPLATNLVEGSYYQPLASALMQSPLASREFSPWAGFEQVRKTVSEAYADKKTYLAASDFSHTDETFREELTLQVYDVIKFCFQNQYREGLKESLVHMHRIPLIVGVDTIVYGEHGVSSGSNWTNFIETVFDFIFGKYARLMMHSALTNLLYAIGDDSAWIVSQLPEGAFSNEQESMANVWKRDLEHLGAQFGLEINASKTMLEANEVKTLQRLFIRGYSQEDSNMLRGVYPTIRALKSSVYPERFHDVKKRDFSWGEYFCCRQFMILENCVDHPLFEAFVKFVVSLHKDLIPFAVEAVKGHKDLVFVDSKSVPGFNPSYNQEKRNATSLSSFKSIQVAAQLEGRSSNPAG